VSATTFILAAGLASLAYAAGLRERRRHRLQRTELQAATAEVHKRAEQVEQHAQAMAKRAELAERRSELAERRAAIAEHHVQDLARTLTQNNHALAQLAMQHALREREANRGRIS